VSYIAFQFFNGICCAAAFYVFCFVINNVERLFGMVLLQLFFTFFYAVWISYDSIILVMETWGSVVICLIYLITVFFCRPSSASQPRDAETQGAEQRFSDTSSDGKGSAVPVAVGFYLVYYLITIMLNYNIYEDHLNNIPYGIGGGIAIIVISIINIAINRNIMYSWILYLVFSLLGFGMLLYDSPLMTNTGSLIYGLGDGLGFVILFFICGGVIKLSKSHRMFRLYCLMIFICYFFISGIFTRIHIGFTGQSNIVSFGIVLVLCCVFLVLLPYLQRKVFDAPWTDGLKLADMPEYESALAKTEQLDEKDNLGLSPREKEIFTLLLTDVPRKEMASTLKIGIAAVHFHINNLYRKLGIQSRLELFTKYRKLEERPAN
jgi:LuxR family transcriptional regulator of spore coat protein